jgi:hypothetical protein
VTARIIASDIEIPKPEKSPDTTSIELTATIGEGALNDEGCSFQLKMEKITNSKIECNKIGS